MSDHAHSHTNDPAEEHHHTPTSQYLMVFAALCVLTGASFFTTSRFWPFHSMPHLTWAFMLAVSCTKALLVILFFMHVLYERNWKYVLTIPCALMSLFLIFMLVPDVGRRDHYASQERLHHSALPRASEGPRLLEEPAPAHP